MIARVVLACCLFVASLCGQDAELGRLLERRRAAHAKLDDVFARALRVGDVDLDELEPFLEHEYPGLRARAIELVDRLDTEREYSLYAGQVTALAKGEDGLESAEADLRAARAPELARLRRELARAAWRRGDSRSRAVLASLVASDPSDTFAARGLLDVGGTRGFEAVLDALATAFDEDLAAADALKSTLIEFAQRSELPKPPKFKSGPARWKRYGTKALKAWPDAIEAGTLVFRSREAFEARIDGLAERWDQIDQRLDWLDEVDVAFGSKRLSKRVLELLERPLVQAQEAPELSVRSLHLLALRHERESLERLIPANIDRLDSWLERIDDSLASSLAATLGALPASSARQLLRELLGLDDSTGQGSEEVALDWSVPPHEVASWAVATLLGPATAAPDWRTAIECLTLESKAPARFDAARRHLNQWAERRGLEGCPGLSATPAEWLSWFDEAGV